MEMPGQNIGQDHGVRLAWPPNPYTEMISAEPDLGSYRAAVADLSMEIASCGKGLRNRHRAEAVVTERIVAPELLAVLSEMPKGAAAAVQTLLSEIRDFRPNACGSALDLADLVRIYLLSRIEIMWWRTTPEFATDIQLRTSADLVDLDALRRQRRLRFRYRRQTESLVGRAVRAADRRLWPDRTPRTAGMRHTQGRPECVALLNELATEFARRTHKATPPLWVNSLTRSVEHQRRLRALGYTAMRPSAHCLGYAVDVEMAWFQQYGAAHALAMLLLERQGTGDVNVIDEGQAWHVCVSPTAAGRLRRDFSKLMRS
jgi:hypothetical protein